MSEPTDSSDAPPLAYERGVQTFMGLELLAGRGVLVPREETELLARTVIAALGAPGAPASPRVIDMCCGSGNLTCAIATACPTATLWASDLTDECVELTRKNVARFELERRVTVVQADLFDGLAGFELDGTIDLVVCNPPYISSGRLAQRPDLAHEPREAFDGGPYGLSIHQRVLKDAPRFLRPGGLLAFEFGLGQERQLKILFDRAKTYDAPEFAKNEAGEPRVVSGKRRMEIA